MELYYQVINVIVKESPRYYENTEEELLTQSGRSREILQKVTIKLSPKMSRC